MHGLYRALNAGCAFRSASGKVAGQQNDLFSESMTALQTTLSSSFNRFFESKKSSGIVLIFCTILSLLVAN